jgi:hypothetical protein
MKYDLTNISNCFGERQLNWSTPTVWPYSYNYCFPAATVVANRLFGTSRPSMQASRGLLPKGNLPQPSSFRETHGPGTWTAP